MFVPKKLINLFIVFLIFPSGIGLSFMENNLDVNKITYLFCLLLTLVFWYRNSSILTRYDLIPIIIILSILPFSVFWLDNLQYLIFFLNIVLFFSSYYVARIIS